MPNEGRLAANKVAGLQFLNNHASIIEDIEPVIQIGCPAIRLNGEDDLCNGFGRCQAIRRNRHVEAHMRVARLQRLANKKLGQLLIKRTVIDSRRIVIECNLHITIATDQLSKWLIVLEINAAKCSLHLCLVLCKRLASHIKGQR